MPLTREQQNERNRQAAAISALLRNPNWTEMERALQRKIDGQEAILLAHVKGQEIDERTVGTILGTIGALNYILGLPKSANGKLARWLDQEGIEVEDE